jgi:uncharacterized membrane protein required for colicin V production
MNLKDLPFNWFDLALVGVLLAGIVRGRKHGMSVELLFMVKWVCVLIGCSYLYEPLGKKLADASPFSLLASYIIVYISVGLVILGFFGLIKHSVGGKLLGSDVFGRAEYYLGMGSGMVRFACVLMAALSLMNSRYFSPAEVRAMEHFQDDVYGSNFFPTWHTAQASIFERSLAGPWIKQNLSFLLIQPTKPEDKRYRQQEAKLPY